MKINRLENIQNVYSTHKLTIGPVGDVLSLFVLSFPEIVDRLYELKI